MRCSPESRLGGRPVLAAPPQAFFDWLRSPKGRRSRPPRISFAGVSGRASVARGGACRRARPGAVLSALLVWLYQRFSSGSISASRLALSELLVWLYQSFSSGSLRACALIRSLSASRLAAQRFSSGLSALLVRPLSASRPASQSFSSGLSALLVWPDLRASLVVPISALLVRRSRRFLSGPRSQQKCKKALPSLRLGRGGRRRWTPTPPLAGPLACL